MSIRYGNPQIRERAQQMELNPPTYNTAQERHFRLPSKEPYIPYIDTLHLIFRKYRVPYIP